MDLRKTRNYASILRCIRIIIIDIDENMREKAANELLSG
jgi:hypothetical protein